MMLKANGEYLDFNGDVEMESQIKLFEEISTSNGEFSYDIDIQDNGQNRKTLGIPRADTVKIIYQKVPSEVIDDSGQSIYTGKLQVNRVEGGFINTTFYSGNTEWMGLLSEPMVNLPLYKYDRDLSEANITASWAETEGLVFPILDTGTLVTRSFANLMVEDFTPCFYVKTLFNEIFWSKGIKLQGDLFDDPTFQKLTVAANNKNQGPALDDRSCYVQKTTAQNSLTGTNKITFQDETNSPYFDGANNNYDNSTYTADIKMRVQIDVVLDLFVIPGSGHVSADVKIYKNGASVKTWYNFVNSSFPNLQIDFSQSTNIIIDAGDTVEVYLTLTDFGAGGSVNVRGGTLKVTPNFSYGVYRIFGTSSVPNWTQAEFVSNVLANFNALPSYNGYTKTLTIDLFNKLKEKPPVDISNEVTIVSTDFTEFVSDYGKNNFFKYQQSDDEDLKEYNISNFIQYGSGNLTIDNDYLQNEADVIDSDFTAPITYINPIFDMSMERINFATLEAIDTKNISSVTDSSGTPRFNITNADTLFQVGDLVRIETGADSDFEYQGDWIVNAVTNTYITVNGLTFGTSADGTATLMQHKFTTDDSVYLFLNVANVQTTFFSSKTSMSLEDASTFTQTSIAYFNLLDTGKSINRVYKQSLSFGSVNNELSYQLSLLDTYWGLFARVVNSPVMAGGLGNLKKSTFDNIKSFLRPIRIDTEETTNLYYLNRNRGYKGSERECELELIKLN